MDFKSWWRYCEHLIETHGHLKKYPCKLCKKECSSLQAFTVHCAKHEEDNKRFQCEICLQKFMFQSTLKNHRCKHGGPIFECLCKDGPGGVPCRNKFKNRCMNITGKPMTYLKLNVCLKGVQGHLLRTII